MESALGRIKQTFQTESIRENLTYFHSKTRNSGIRCPYCMGTCADVGELEERIFLNKCNIETPEKGMGRNRYYKRTRTNSIKIAHPTFLAIEYKKQQNILQNTTSNAHQTACYNQMPPYGENQMGPAIFVRVPPPD